MYHICNKCKTEISFCTERRSGSTSTKSSIAMVKCEFICPVCKNKISYSICEAIEVYRKNNKALKMDKKPCPYCEISANNFPHRACCEYCGRLLTT